MRIKTLGLIGAIAMLGSSASADQIFLDPFDSAGNFTTSTSFFSDADVSSGYDFFGITDGVDGGGNDNFGVNSFPHVKAYTGFDGTFLTGMDLDGEGASMPITLTWSGINISGYSNLTLSADLAEYFDSPGDIDIADYIIFEVQIDGGGYVKVLEFRGDTDAYNGLFAVDTNADGIGDGTALGNAAAQFQAAIAGTGSSLDVRVSIKVDAGDEDFAMDNLLIEGSLGGASSSSSAGASSSSASSSSAPSVTLIHDIQGNGSVSPMVDQIVTVEGIVVGDFQTDDAFNGFFLQEEDTDADADPMTSEGIFVYQKESWADVAVGDKVRFEGKVAEYNYLTELTDVYGIEILSSGNTLPTAAEVTLPFASPDGIEAYEGMRVAFTQTLTVSDTYNLGRYGELLLSYGGRLQQPTEVAIPGAAANAIEAANLLNQVMLDDGLSDQNPDPLLYPAPELIAGHTVRGGDEVVGLEGVVYEIKASGEELWLIEPTDTSAVQIASVNPRPSAPAAQGSLRVASFNVLNFFTTVDNGSPICGPDADMECRGADSAEEYTRQFDKLVSALQQINADVYGLMELENNADQTAVATLAAALPGYDYIRNPGEGALGGDAITVGILYNTATVSPVGDSATINDGEGSVLGTIDTTDIHTFDNYNRKPLLQTFEDADGDRFSVCVNHFKSKGSLTAFPEDVDQGDGQGNNNYTRTKAAEDVIAWLATDPTGSGDVDFIVMGDINAYGMEDPVTTFTGAGYTKLDDDYSYSYDGRWGALDHAFATMSMALQVVHAEEYHINADEPTVFDYNIEYKSANHVNSLYSVDEFRTSDHDPIVIDLELQPNVPMIEVTPLDNPLYFGMLQPYGYSYRTLWIKNTGLADLNFMIDLMAFGFPAFFFEAPIAESAVEVSELSCLETSVLKPEESCYLDIVYHPTFNGIHSAKVSITSNAPMPDTSINKGLLGAATSGSRMFEQFTCMRLRMLVGDPSFECYGAEVE